MRQHYAQFANFICRFGAEKVLLDYAKDIVIPAFTDDTLVRSFGQTTHYHLYDVSLKTLEHGENPVIGIIGRFIKDTELSREQIFDPKKGLIKDEQRIKSSPSAFFVLILNNHRLIYFPETAHASDLSAFKATMIDFIKQKHKKFIEEIYKDEIERGNSITKKELNIEHPYPSLEVVPLSGDEDIEHFVHRYKSLNRVEFRLVRPNDELDGEEIFKEIREYFGSLNPDKTVITSSSQEGLDIEATVSTIKDAVATGNQEVKLSGKDAEGNSLRGYNDSFKINTPIEDVPLHKDDLALKLYDAFISLVDSKAIKIGEHAQGINNKIKTILSLF